jgi:molybdate/tungstate transport system ATP-binding protein
VIELRELQVQQGSFTLGPLRLKVDLGQYCVIMGRTGSGKSTLLECLAGLRHPTSGQLQLRGKVVNNVIPAERQLGYVRQDALVFPTMSVFDNLAFGLVVRGVRRADINIRVSDLAERLQIQQILHRPARDLSGGEARRVALGRALAFRPDILLLDEPLTGLDQKTRELLLELLLELRNSRKVSVIHVTHDPVEAELLADLLLALQDGRLESQGSRISELPLAEGTSN